MDIKLKRVPFSIDLAKEITDGKINGAKIMTGDNLTARIVAFDTKGEYPITALVFSLIKGKEEPMSFTENGWHRSYVNDLHEDLRLYVPINYNNYHNFVPQKWQPCLVREENHTWSIRVATGEYTKDNKPCFFSAINKITTYGQYLPLSKLTLKLLDTFKSYEELLEEEYCVTDESVNRNGCV